MKQAIKILENRISIINSEIDKTEMVLDECELSSEYEFAMCDMANFELEVIELQKAIQILNNYVV